MIWKGVTGMTSRCSTVPCSRSRISAAPVSTTASMVMALTISMTAPNQELVQLRVELVAHDQFHLRDRPALVVPQERIDLARDDRPM